MLTRGRKKKGPSCLSEDKEGKMDSGPVGKKLWGKLRLRATRKTIT